MSSECITLSTIKNALDDKFTKNSLRMFNFHGIEIQDDYDLNQYRDPHEKNKFIFLTVKGEQFNSAFLMKIFKIIKKIGEVRILT